MERGGGSVDESEKVGPPPPTAHRRRRNPKLRLLPLLIACLLVACGGADRADSLDGSAPRVPALPASDPGSGFSGSILTSDFAKRQDASVRVVCRVEGAPVPARVRLVLEDGTERGVTADLGGSARFDSLPSGPYEIRVAYGELTQWAQGTLEVSGSEFHELELVSAHQLAIRVMDESKVPMAGMGVRLDRLGHLAVADETGRVEFSLPRGSVVVVTADDPNWEPLDGPIKVRMKGDRAVDLRLRRFSAIEGRLTDPNGAPVVGASVAGLGPPVVSDERGRFRLERVSARTQSIVAWRGLDGLAGATVVTPLAGPSFPEVDVSMSPVGNVTVTMLDVAGAPLEGQVRFGSKEEAFRSLRRLMDGESKGEIEASTTGETLELLGALLPGLRYRLRCSSPEYESVTLAREANDLSPHWDAGTVTLRRLGVLSGVVRDQLGAPAAGAVVTARRGRRDAVVTKTDAEGRYRLVRLPAGAHGLSVTHRSAEGLSSTAWLLSQTVAYDDPVDGLDFILKPDVVVEGRVLELGGPPLAKMPVRATVSAVIPVLSDRDAKTDADGTYRIDIPAGVRIELGPLVPADRGRPCPTEEVIGAEFAHLRRDFTVDPGVRVLGTLYDEQGRPAAGTLHLQRPGARVARLQTNPAGSYTSECLPDGDYMLSSTTGEASGRTFFTVSRADSGTSKLVDLSLTPVPQVGGSVWDRWGAPVGRQRIEIIDRDFPWLRWRVQTDRAGAFRVNSCFPGRYELRVLGRRTKDPVHFECRSTSRVPVALVVTLTD